MLRKTVRSRESQREVSHEYNPREKNCISFINNSITILSVQQLIKKEMKSILTLSTTDFQTNFKLKIL